MNKTEKIKRQREKIKTLKKTVRYYELTIHTLIGRLSRFETKIKKMRKSGSPDRYQLNDVADL